MKLAIAQLISCDAVVQLPGWQNSKGAMCEFYLANDLDLQIISQQDFEIFYLSKPEAPKQMPEWICHKRVRAAKIRSIVQTDINAGGYLVLDNGTNAKVDYGWLKKHCPKLGGYYVEYKDGYHSYSPADSFEEGYSLAPDMKPITVEQLAAMSSELAKEVLKSGDGIQWSRDVYTMTGGVEGREESIRFGNITGGHQESPSPSFPVDRFMRNFGGKP